LANGYVTARLLYKYGKNDYELWTVDISESDFKEVMQDSVRLSGKIESIMENIPMLYDEPATVCHFLFTNKDSATIITSQVSKDFVERYHDEGFSVRGCKQEILNEILEEKSIVITMTPEEASAVSAVLELELCNCDDPNRESLLTAVMDRLDQAVSDCCQFELPDNEEGLEP